MFFKETDDSRKKKEKSLSFCGQSAQLAHPPTPELSYSVFIPLHNRFPSRPCLFLSTHTSIDLPPTHFFFCSHSGFPPPRPHWLFFFITIRSLLQTHVSLMRFIRTGLMSSVLFYLPRPAHTHLSVTPTPTSKELLLYPYVDICSRPRWLLLTPILILLLPTPDLSPHLQLPFCGVGRGSSSAPKVASWIVDEMEVMSRYFRSLARPCGSTGGRCQGMREREREMEGWAWNLLQPQCWGSLWFETVETHARRASAPVSQEYLLHRFYRLTFMSISVILEKLEYPHCRGKL